MKKYFICLLSSLVLFLCVSYFVGQYPSQSTQERLRKHAAEAKEYCLRNHLSMDYCFLVDFDVHFGRNRFFVWDFHRNKLVYSTICAHGRGGNSSLLSADFSNAHGSHCSSVGRYKVGVSRTMFNHTQIPCLELWGMDPTCSNAHARGILIHPSVAQIPTWPLPMLHRTLGCFGVSLRGFNKLKQFKEQTNQPVLLWAYN